MSDSKPPLAFKGFDHKWQCREYQYAVGESYEHKGAVKACGSGFHACEVPLEVFGYYPPVGDGGLLHSFALVECSGEIHRDGSDSKIASAKIHIKAELSIPQLVGHMVSWVISQIDATIPQAATNTGYRSAATNTGDQSAATNTGNYSAATNTGDQSAATNTGDYSAATMEGKHGVAASLGIQGKAMAVEGSAIVLCHRNDKGELLHIKAGIAGRDIKANVWYVLNDKDEFEEVL